MLKVIPDYKFTMVLFNSALWLVQKNLHHSALAPIRCKIKTKQRFSVTAIKYIPLPSPTWRVVNHCWIHWTHQKRYRIERLGDDSRTQIGENQTTQRYMKWCPHKIFLHTAAKIIAFPATTTGGSKAMVIEVERKAIQRKESFPSLLKICEVHGVSKLLWCWENKLEL